ncbi:MAG: M55 family metallopeptidase [Candidatus Brocadiia bacterium]
MKIYIMTDLEGPALVSRWSQTRDYDEEPERKREAMRFLTGEVSAAVDGILDAAPEAEVVVWDAHGSGGIDLQEFHSGAKLISRGPISPPYYLDDSYDALFFVGQHAMAGTENANLCHTYSSRTIEYFKLNDQFVGEFGARAVMAGTFDVPAVFISGDDKAVDEAKALCPSIYGAVVKWSLGEELALHLSHQAARAKIQKTASSAVHDIDSVPPIQMDPPFELEIRVKEGCESRHYVEQGAGRLDERTVVFRSEDICDLPI